MSRWKDIALYGLALGCLLAFLQCSHYKLMILMHAREGYIALIAVLFTGLGIWAGYSWTAKKTQEERPPQMPAFSADAAAAEKSNLSVRELEVLTLMAEGLSNQEIADRLFLSLNTIKTHASNLFSKLDVQRRTQAIQRAKELNILRSPERMKGA